MDLINLEPKTGVCGEACPHQVSFFRAFMRVMTSSKRITSDGFISSSACISKSAATGILSGVYSGGVLKDDRAFPSSSGIVRRVLVDIEQPVVSTIIPVPTSVLV